MPKYECWLPTWASVRYVMETEEPLTPEELRERFLDECHQDASVCHRCANGVDLGDCYDGDALPEDVEIQEVAKKSRW